MNYPQPMRMAPSDRPDYRQLEMLVCVSYPAPENLLPATSRKMRNREKGNEVVMEVVEVVLLDAEAE